MTTSTGDSCWADAKTVRPDRAAFGRCTSRPAIELAPPTRRCRSAAPALCGPSRTPESASMQRSGVDVSLAVCPDLSPANLIVTSDVRWDRLVTFGPAGFAAYARVRFIPDPTHHGQQESEADLDASPSETEQWRALLQLLATETSDPSNCYFGLWEGWGFPESARRWPTSVFPAALKSPPAPSFCFAGHSRRLRSGVTPQRPGSGPAGVLPGRHARVRVAVRPHVVRRSRRLPTLGRDRSDRADDRTARR